MPLSYSRSPRYTWTWPPPGLYPHNLRPHPRVGTGTGAPSRGSLPGCHGRTPAGAPARTSSRRSLMRSRRRAGCSSRSRCRCPRRGTRLSSRLSPPAREGRIRAPLTTITLMVFTTKTCPTAALAQSSSRTATILTPRRQRRLLPLSLPRRAEAHVRPSLDLDSRLPRT